MNPVFWALALLACVVLWFVLDRFFIPLGRLLLKKWDKTLNILNEEVEITKECNMEEKENE